MEIIRIPDEKFNLVCSQIEKQFGKIPFPHHGIVIKYDLIKSALEILNAEPTKTLAQRSCQQLRALCPDGLDRRIKYYCNSDLRTANIISDVLEKAGIAQQITVINPETQREIQGTRLNINWQWNTGVHTNINLGENQPPVNKESNTQNYPQTKAPTADDFKKQIDSIFISAQGQNKNYIDIKSGSLHRLIGGYPGSHHRMPLCCDVMYQLMQKKDIVLSSPPKGKGASLVIRYFLPRDTQPVTSQIQPAPKTVNLSQPSAPDFIIERTVFDPVTGTFLISKNRPLINVESWIRKSDQNSYWFVICIHNNSNSLIDEWGVELDSSASLRILECHIEGMEHAPALNESHPVPWQSKWIVGIPHHFGITLPRGGSRRLYFKLSSSTCGVSHSVRGTLIAPGGIQIPIREKLFDHSCDVATLSTALSKNPVAAEQYTEKFLMRSYSRDTAIKLFQCFKLVQGIDRSCAIGNHDATVDKLKQLIDALEGIQVSPSLIESVKSNLWAIQHLGDTEDASIRGQRLCENIITDWMNEVIYKKRN